MSRDRCLQTLVSACLFLTAAVPAPAQEPSLRGGGEYAIDRSVPCLTEAERAEIRSRIAASRAELRVQGRLAPVRADRSGSTGTAAAAVQFEWPLKLKDGLTDPGIHGISNFVDQNPAYPNQLLDYQCGGRTYDQASGYNHQGIDFFSWPFGFYKMDNDIAEIVAAAPGVILFKSNGNYDRNCGFGAGNWNAVYVEHADGSIAWYGHMKNLSLTSKLVGDSVQAGEYLGVVGSSGNSTGPHLHLEVYDALDDLIEPYAGPCNAMNGDSWWAQQRPYYDSAINLLLTHDAPPVFPGCPSTEIPNDEIFFLPGETAYFAAYYRDQLQGQVSQYAVYDADNGLVESWSASLGVPHYAASYWYWYFTLPPALPEGWWRFEVTYQGETYEHFFYVGDPTAVDDPTVHAGTVRLAGGVPNPTRAGTTLEYELPRSGWVRLAVRDVRGRTVAVLEEGSRSPGVHRAAWHGLDADGRAARPGVYFAELAVNGVRMSQKLVVSR